jgi:hypothetical protein
MTAPGWNDDPRGDVRAPIGAILMQLFKLVIC